VWRSILILLLAALAAESGRAEPTAREVRLMIGPEISVVRELREIAFTATEQVVEVEGIPATADLTTLQVGGERQGVRLLDWQRVTGATSAPPAGKAFRWAPGEPLRASASAQREGVVRCRLEAATLRTRWVEFVYQVRGLSWLASYEIIIRGDVANHLEPLSLDLQGYVQLSNATGRAFADAQILLVGRRESVESAPKAPGLLMLDEWSPLADRWRPPLVNDQDVAAYTLPNTVSLPAQGSVSVRRGATRRQAAERLYSLDARLISSGEGEPWQPLTRYLVLPNDAAHGLGQALPPGDALIYLGGVRGGPYQKARLRHTDPGRDVRVSLGASRGVTANRRADPRQPGTAGSPEQTFTLQLANALPTAVKVVALERPPVPLAWDLVRASRSVERRGPLLSFDLELAARSEAEINYTVRLVEPAP
jgi:hypothetical protein